MKIEFPQEKSKVLEAKLNTSQLEAVTTINGPLLIIAGAGSGKTRVITHRIAYLIEQGKSPDSILALTFTNKAAKEMKDRITKIIDPRKVSQVWAGTFHSIFARILRVEAPKLNYTRDFTIYDQDDSLAAIRTVMSNLGINIQNLSPQNVRSRISSAKNRMISHSEYARAADNSNERITAQIYTEYEEYLKKSNAMDFDDLLLNVIKLFRESKETLFYYQDKFRYLLVDEYQDTNKAQYISINMLAKSHQNICVVGDDAQSIYRWRGADIQNILDFQKDYPYCKVVKLEQNYRSTKNILAAADAIIKKNRNQLKKEVWTANPEGNKIHLISNYTDREEAEKIAELILHEKKTGVNFGSIAVFYRTNSQSLLFENSFRKENIPYVLVGSLSFYKRKEIKDVMAYFRLLLNTNDDEALLRIINEPPRGIGLTSLKYFKAYASQFNISLFEAFKKAEEIHDLQKRAQIAAKDFVKLFEEYDKLAIEQNSWQSYFEFIRKTGYITMLEELQSEEALDRIDNIEQLFTDIQRYFEDNEDGNLSGYLQQISLATDADDKELSEEKVTLMTVHSAKGLEFPTVFVTGLEQGLFPLERQDMHPEEKEEERRLFYVAVTRAMERLYLSYSHTRSKFGTKQNVSLSQFVREIPKDLLFTTFESYSDSNAPVKKLIPKSEFNRGQNEYSQLNSTTENYSQILGQSGLRPGDLVRHQQFGQGKIISLSGFGKNQKADVFFESIGKKSMLLMFAKLDKI
ncbi:MAG TPA: UvrD-helicase domain-containing protein [Candidatus Kapabacteria bacterium]|nr:UvrD-helicase domain-containing protein [Candidatus Kapabacteria bacterium]